MRTRALYTTGGVLWWLLRRLHPCGINLNVTNEDVAELGAFIATAWGLKP